MAADRSSARNPQESAFCDRTIRLAVVHGVVSRSKYISRCQRKYVVDEKHFSFADRYVPYCYTRSDIIFRSGIAARVRPTSRDLPEVRKSRSTGRRQEFRK